MKNKITKEKFQTYKMIRDSGITNMFDVTRVIKLSNNSLTREDCIDIMNNYSKYAKQFV